MLPSECQLTRHSVGKIKEGSGVKPHPDTECVRELKARPIGIDGHRAQVQRKYPSVPYTFKNQIQSVTPSVAHERRILCKCEQATDSSEEFVVKAHDPDIRKRAESDHVGKQDSGNPAAACAGDYCELRFARFTRAWHRLPPVRSRFEARSPLL